MSGSTPEFVSVEMGGLKAALISRARAERSSISTIVRRAVSRELGQDDEVEGVSTVAGSASVKVSIRLTADEAALLACNAHRAKLGRGAYLASLMAGGPSGNSGEARVKLLAALSASNAELSALTHALHHVAVLLRQASAAAALEYRGTLLGMREAVTRHLGLAAALLAECRPYRRGARSLASRVSRRGS